MLPPKGEISLIIKNIWIKNQTFQKKIHSMYHLMTLFKNKIQQFFLTKIHLSGIDMNYCFTFPNINNI